MDPENKKAVSAGDPKKQEEGGLTSRLNHFCLRMEKEEYMLSEAVRRMRASKAIPKVFMALLP